MREDYVEMPLLKSICENPYKKVNNEEIELVYRLSIKEGHNENAVKTENNEKNIIIGWEYLYQCLLCLNNIKLDGNPIIDKLLEIIEKDN